MPFPSRDVVNQLRLTWEGRYVEGLPTAPSKFQRFAGRIGRVVTVNWNGCVIVDFADGAWYDVPNPDATLAKIEDPARIATFDSTANSAQPLPTRQA